MCFFKPLVLVVLALACAALLLRLGLGSSKYIGSPLNAESIAFLAFLLYCLYGGASARRNESLDGDVGASDWVPALGVASVAVAAYFASPSNPFLFDDYTHLGMAGSETWRQMISRSLVDHPQSGDFFFRPVGYASYWLDYHWAGVNPVSWHLWSVALQAMNSVLVYALCRQLSFRRFGALVAGLVFALHAAHPEVAAWMAARFDLLAFFFSLLTLLALNRFVDTRKLAWLMAMVVNCALAVLSKEAAFCLPLLAVCLMLFGTRRPAKEIARLAGVLAVLCGLVFCYRAWFLGGIGGYRTAGDAPTILNFSLLRSAKALFYRQWALLLFPVNWSAQPEFWLILAGLIFVAAMLFFLPRARGRDSRLVGCLALVLAAALPVQHLLLIGADLAGARVLYLPTLGLALFWGLLLEDRANKSAVALAAGLLFFQLAALEHNLRIWGAAARLSRQTCLQAAQELRRDPHPIAVRGLPQTWNGVYFLKNGFAQCVAVASGQPGDAGRVTDSPLARQFSWDGASQKLLPDAAGSQ